MTPDKTPTDAEIMREADKVGGLFDVLAIGYQSDDILKFARAVLAKWGSPVVAGAPDRYMDDRGYTVTKEWLDSDDATSDYRAAYTTPVYLTPQPTQAQAGAVPLTFSQIHEWWESENGLEDCEMCRITDFLRVVRAVEEKLGIREGGQHG